MKTKNIHDRVWSFFSRYSDSAFISAIRNGVHWLTRYLHAENHDFRTNGESYLLNSIGPDTRCIFDVGANHGEWALMAHRICPAADIYCFEISAHIRKALWNTVAGIDGMHVLDFGLAEAEDIEKVKFYPEKDVVTSMYDFPHPEAYIWTEEKVSTGDTFLSDHNVEHIDLLKIDTEGADFRVLRGFDSALSQGRISIIQFEYGYACILARKLLIDFYEYLEGNHYMIGKLHTKGVDFHHYRLEDENFFGPNYVAVHKSRPDLISKLRKSGKQARRIPSLSVYIKRKNHG